MEVRAIVGAERNDECLGAGKEGISICSWSKCCFLSE
jgi:hypothetical protein